MNLSDTDLGAPSCLVEGFMRAARGTTLFIDVRQRVARDWARRVAAKERSSTAQTCRDLNALTWSWPDFDAMLQVLVEDDLWPTPWHHYKSKVKSGADLRDVRAKILVSTARTASTSIQNAHDKSFNTMLRLGGWHLHVDSEVGAHYTAKLARLVDSNDPETWPPFFPGDQTRIQHSGDGEVYTLKGRFLGLNASPPFGADS